MRYLTVILALSAALGGCSDKRQNDRTGVAAPAAAVPVPVRLERNLPATFTGVPSEVGGRCAVDIINKPLTAEVFSIKRSEGFVIYGWALDDKNGLVPPVAALQLAGDTITYFAPLTRRGDRDDLSKAFGKPEFSQAGFGAVVDIAALPVNKYEVSIIQKGEKTSIVCPTQIKLTLGD